MRKIGPRPDYNIPESFKAFWRMVSFTAANTRRMLLVSVACVKLIKKIRLDSITTRKKVDK